jgi:hypothetical protein
VASAAGMSTWSIASVRALKPVQTADTDQQILARLAIETGMAVAPGAASSAHSTTFFKTSTSR